jgi:hypothetical protein
LSDNGFADKLKRFSDMMDETRLMMTILQFARSGHATDVMVEQAIALVDRQIVVIKSDGGDDSWLKPALNLKAGLEKALVDGVKSLRVGLACRTLAQGRYRYYRGQSVSGCATKRFPYAMRDANGFSS